MCRLFRAKYTLHQSNTDTHCSGTSSVNPDGPIQNCTTTIFKEPSYATNCTVYAGVTMTSTASVDCGGCVLETRLLGHGLVSLVALELVCLRGVLRMC